MLINLVAVFIGGGIGSVARFGISALMANYYRTVFPAATLCANVLSCLVLGLAVYLAGEKLNAEVPVRLLVITGFCGGFSTFSAFSHETVELMKGGNMGYALLNVALSISACVGIMYLLIRSNA